MALQNTIRMRDLKGDKKKKNKVTTVPVGRRHR